MPVTDDSPRPRPLAGAIGALILTAILLALTAPTAGQCAMQRLDPDDPGQMESFGAGLAIFGDLALVGAPGEDAYGPNFGVAHVYAFDGSEWIAQGVLPPPSTQDVELFGGAIDMHGDRAIVGAAVSELDYPSHAAFIYKFDGESWQEEAYLPASDTIGHVYYVTPWVAIEGDLACVGCHSDDQNGPDSGAVYVYRYDPGAEEWVEEQQLRPDDGGEDQQFGESVAFAGDMLLVGTYQDDEYGERAGAVYVFRFDPDDGQWHQEAKLIPADADEDDMFGISIAVSGDRAVIGAWGDDHGGEGGAARMYRYEAGHWSEEAVLKPSDGQPADGFGYACAIADDLIVVGATGVDDDEDRVGAMYVFRHDGTSWVEEGRFVNVAGGEDDRLGIRVALGGHGALASAWRADGAAYGCGAVFGVAFAGEDCNRNNMCDRLDLADGTSEDCNVNEIPDECDIAVEFADASGPLSPIGQGSPQIHTIVSPPFVFEEEIEFHFTASADLDESDQYIDIDINGYSFGTVFETWADLCDDPPDQDAITVPQPIVNYLIEDGGDLAITMTASEAVDAAACGGESWIAVEVVYTAHGPNDANHNGIPDECECPADLDGDGDVDTADLLFLLGAWGTPDGDVDFDGDTDTADLLLLLGSWGECPGGKS